MLSALGLARAIEAGELTPAQAVDLCADAIAKREGEVGAFVTLDLEAARKAAQTPGLKDKPLRGLPVALKDIFDTADMPTEYGSPIYAGHRPKADASLVALIRRAGGTLIGKTVTTEFAHLDPGKTRNPRNLAHTPGGSSSGSAAGVAAGFFPIATGTQTGGSVIRPASFCGVTGFKPSYRLLPTVGMKCVSWHLDTAGLFAASVADVAFAAAAISDRDLRVDGGKPVIAADRRAARAALGAGQRRHEGSARQRRAGGLGRQRPRARHHAAAGAGQRVPGPHDHPGLRGGALACLRIRALRRTSSPRASSNWSRAALPSAPTPMTTPGAPPARRAARCRT